MSETTYDVKQLWSIWTVGGLRFKTAAPLTTCLHVCNHSQHVSLEHLRTVSVPHIQQLITPVMRDKWINEEAERAESSCPLKVLSPAGFTHTSRTVYLCKYFTVGIYVNVESTETRRAAN